MQTTAITRVNLIDNPSFEQDVNNWATFTATLSRTTSDFYVGSACASMTPTSSGGVAISNVINTVSGTLYALQARVKGTAGDIIFLQGYSGAAQNGYIQITADGTWQLIDTIFSAVTSTLYLEVGGVTVGHPILIDAVLVEQGPSLESYFDGNSGIGYTWSGAVNESLSFMNGFQVAEASNYHQVATGIQISWDKQTASGINYFTIGKSVIGGSDIIATSQPGTIAQAGQYDYQNIPASGIVSWQTSMKLDQFPYGLVQRQADVVLNDAGMQYMPASGTPYGPYQVPARPIIISAGFVTRANNTETIPMFTGFTDTPVNDTPARTTTLHAYDAINSINAFTSVATRPFVNASATTIFTTLLEEMGFGTNQFVLEPSLNTTIPYLDPYGLLIGDIFKQLCEAEAGIMFADESGIIHFWNRQHFNNNATPVWTLTYSNMRNLSQQTTSIINSVEVQSSPLTLLSGVQNVYSIDQPYYVQAASTSGINWIANPSFEGTGNGSTTDWAGATLVSGTQPYIGEYAASGSNIVYNKPHLMPSNVGTNNSVASASAFVYVTPGNSTKLTIFGQTASGSTYGSSISNTITGSPQWQQLAVNGLVGINVAQPWYMAFSGIGGGFLLDAVTTDLTQGYYDGSFPSTNINTYTWSGAVSNSSSIKTAIPQYLAIQVNLGFDTFSLVPPVASGLNASTIGALQSFFSFSSMSGIGGIFGADMTSSMALQAYSVSGSTAWLIWQNLSPTQAYLTNLQLFGEVADTPNITIDEVYSNQASKRQYGLNPANAGQVLNINNNYVPTAPYAQSLARYLVDSYSTPFLRHSTDNFAVLGIQFGDPVTLVNRDTGESRLAFCLGITNKVNKNADIKQQLIFQERNVQNYFTIGISTIGGASVIAP